MTPEQQYIHDERYRKNYQEETCRGRRLMDLRAYSRGAKSSLKPRTWRMLIRFFMRSRCSNY